MKYKILISKKANKNVKKLPAKIRKKFEVLVDRLETTGPIQHNLPNYSQLGKNRYHCHLAYSWVAVWKHEGKSIIMEVTYVGSRENAPY